MHVLSFIDNISEDMKFEEKKHRKTVDMKVKVDIIVSISMRLIAKL
jgi:hypothetical protein